jgi:hypothetical protein
VRDGLLLQCGNHPNLEGVRLALELTLVDPHVLRDPAIVLWYGQQSTAHGCLGNDTNIRTAAGIVNESTEGSHHAGPFYTVGQERAA